MQALRFIFKNLDQYTKQFYIALTAGILAGVSAFLIPVALAEFTKEPLTHQNVFRLICVLIGLYLFSLIVAYMVRGKGEAMAFTYAHHIRLKYFRKLSSVPT